MITLVNTGSAAEMRYKQYLPSQRSRSVRGVRIPVCIACLLISNVLIQVKTTKITPAMIVVAFDII